MQFRYWGSFFLSSHKLSPWLFSIHPWYNNAFIDVLLCITYIVNVQIIDYGYGHIAQVELFVDLNSVQNLLYIHWQGPHHKLVKIVLDQAELKTLKICSCCCHMGEIPIESGGPFTCITYERLGSYFRSLWYTDCVAKSQSHWSQWEFCYWQA